MLTFYTPPGIGDFSAMYAKLCNINREITIRSSCDFPYRLSPFLDLLPKVKNGGYAAHTSMTAIANTLPSGIDLATLEDGDYFLSINKWLEDGGKIADWVPGKTTYHYEIDNEFYAEEARGFLKTLPDGPRVGIYCSAYGNSRHWGFWGNDEWRTFVHRISAMLPRETQYLLIGAEYDLAIAEILNTWMKSNELNSHWLVGQYHIGATIEMIRQMDYLFSFPSGLAFLADVVNTPNMMWLPDSMQDMRGTFTDPENYESKKSLHILFSSPESSAEQFRLEGLRHMEERCQISRSRR